MNTDPSLFPAIMAGVVPIMYALLAKPGQRAPEVDAAGVSHLRLPKIYLIMGWVCIGLGAVGTVGMAIALVVGTDAPPWFIVLLIGLVFAAMGAGGIFLLKAYANHAVTFDEATLTVTNDFGHTERMGWSDLASGELRNKSRILVLHKRDGRKVKVNPHLIGFEALLRTLQRKTDFPVDAWRAQLAKPKGSW